MFNVTTLELREATGVILFSTDLTKESLEPLMRDSQGSKIAVGGTCIKGLKVGLEVGIFFFDSSW